MRLAGLIDRAYAQTGKQVAVIIDEYDAPLLDVLHEDEVLREMREVMQEFYQRLKMQEPYIKFCFITGITKFSPMVSGNGRISPPRASRPAIFTFGRCSFWNDSVFHQ